MLTAQVDSYVVFRCSCLERQRALYGNRCSSRSGSDCGEKSGKELVVDQRHLKDPRRFPFHLLSLFFHLLSSLFHPDMQHSPLSTITSAQSSFQVSHFSFHVFPATFPSGSYLRHISLLPISAVTPSDAHPPNKFFSSCLRTTQSPVRTPKSLPVATPLVGGPVKGQSGVRFVRTLWLVLLGVGLFPFFSASYSVFPADNKNGSLQIHAASDSVPPGQQLRRSVFPPISQIVNPVICR